MVCPNCNQSKLPDTKNSMMDCATVLMTSCFATYFVFILKDRVFPIGQVANGRISITKPFTRFGFMPNTEVIMFPKNMLHAGIEFMTMMTPLALMLLFTMAR